MTGERRLSSGPVGVVSGFLHVADDHMGRRRIDYSIRCIPGGSTIINFLRTLQAAPSA